MSMITIRGRLTLWYAAVFVATGAAVLAAMYYLVRREFISAGQAVIDGIGTPVAIEPGNAGPTGPTAQPSVMAATPMAGTPLPSPSTHPPDIVEAATTQARTDALRTIVVDTGALFAVLTAVSLLLCWLVARRALRPLRQITSTAAELSHDSLDARITLPGPRDEIRTLADAFDAMLDRLQRAFRSQRLFVANASHELRTPLTIIRTAAEMALDRDTRPEAQYRQALATIATAAARSDAILTSLLHLAQTRHSPTRAPVDLDRLAADAAIAWPANAPRLHTSLHAAPCAGDPTQLELLLRNLLENAARYNTTSGDVWLATGHGELTCWLRVDNTGPTVRPDDVPALRQPFQRGATRTGTTGAGMGLAIVDAIADAHGARLTAAARPGGGLTVTLTLPVR